MKQIKAHQYFLAMKLKKHIIFAFLFLFSTLSLVAQHRFSKEDFKQKRAAFLKSELNLTPTEAARFLPLSEELMDKKFALNRDARKKARAIRDRNNVTNAEYEDVIDTWINCRVKEALLEKEYYQKFKQVLPMYKLRKYQEVDIKFMRSIMEQREKGNNQNSHR